MTGTERPAFDPKRATAVDQLKRLAAGVLPQHAISRLVQRITRSEQTWLSRTLIRLFLLGYTIDLSAAAEPDLRAYRSFNAFFTRALREGSRPLPPDADSISAPCDGRVSACGPINAGTLLQAKGLDYSLANLLGGDGQLAERFEGGTFLTVYLAPFDYHRVHAPLDGRLLETRHVPGRLFPVGQGTVRAVPGLFARNERLVCLFDAGDPGTSQAAGAHAVPFAVVLVGALNVGSIETVWAGQVTPPRGRSLQRRAFDAATGPHLGRGEELGRFNMGSTVILLLPRELGQLLPDLAHGDVIRVRQAIGKRLNADPV